MRPIKLGMRAFGPFAEAQEIDFGVLGGQTLFLIHGRTGAGKSSILDAIAFALYGETSAGERDPRDVRSHHAGLDDPTEVVLELEAGHGRYRVRRRPEQELTRSRGEGTTVRPSEAELHRWDDTVGDWRLAASGVRDVGREVEALLGFEAAQFRQVVVLPQGEFRRLLTADSRDREEILATLFRTDRFQRIQEELERRARALRRDAENRSTRMRTLLEEHEVDDAAALGGLLEELRREAARHEVAIAEARADEARLAEDRDRARDARDRLAARDAAERHLAEVETQREAVDRHRAELEAARRAAAVDDLLDDVDGRRRDLARREGELNRLTGERDRAVAERGNAAAALATEESRTDERRAAERDLERLEAAGAAFDALERAEAEAAGAAAEVERAVARRDSAEREAADAAAALEALDRRIADDREIAAGAAARRLEHEHLRAALESTGRLLRTGAERTAAAKVLEAAQTRVEKAAAAAERTQRRLEKLRATLREARAAALARELEDGEPCPVCGSTDHPAPAHGGDEVPGDDAVAATEAARDVARTRLEASRREEAEAAAELRGAQVREEELRAALGDLAGLSAEEIEGRAAAAGRDREAAEAATTRLQESAAERERLVARRDAGRAEVETTTRQAGDARDTATRLATIAAHRRSDVPEGLRDRAAVDEAVSAARARATALEKALAEARRLADAATAAAARLEERVTSAADELEAAKSTLGSREIQLAGRLAEAGFTDEEALRAARRDREMRARLEREVTEWDHALAAATDARDRAAARAAGIEPPDVDAAEAAWAEAKARLEQLVRQHSTVAQRAGHVGRAFEAVAGLTADLERIDAAHGVAGELAGVAGDRHMPFSRFVVAAMLDEVLLEATRRLTAMSRGRFALRRAEELRDRRRSGGLDLVVFDAHTGSERPVATLSGGEGFLASLALALGLADVVQRDTGGLTLDTVFVDEGFGTLDPEALDLAYATLLDIHAEGRLVGIISHVPDLKERIPARIEVIPGQRGSRVRVVV